MTRHERFTTGRHRSCRAKPLKADGYDEQMPTYDQIVQWIGRVRTHPVDELNRWQRSVRYFIDLIRHCARQLTEDRAEEMAAALTYRTIFGLIPLLVLALVIFRIFGGFEEMQQKVQPALFRFLGIPEVQEGYGSEPKLEEPVLIVPQDLEEQIAEEAQQKQAQAEAMERGETPPPEAREQDDQAVRTSIQVALTDTIAKIANLNFGSIGIVGLTVFIYAAMTLAIAVEYNFNIIFKSPTGRPWHLRIPIYWAVITLGSGMLALSLYLSGQIVEEASELPIWNIVIQGLSRALAFLVSWTLLFLLYLLIPNTRVRVRPALMGSFVAALLWELGKVGFQTYVNVALPYSTLYGSLGLIPLFLFWVYISWLIVLFGLELTYALQTMRGRRSRLYADRQDGEPVLDPRWLIPTMAAAGEAFQRGKTITCEDLSERMALPARSVSQLVQRLQREGLLHRIDDQGDEEDPGYTLALPPEQIRVDRLLELGRSMSMNKQAVRKAPGHEVLEALAEAESRAAEGETLATMLGRNGDDRV